MHRRLLLQFAVCFCLLLSGCLRPSAVDDFAKASAQAAALFPAVATIPYDSCVASERYRQLAGVTEFRGDFDFDQPRIDAACKPAHETSERLKTTYKVLSTYIETLDKLAGGHPPTFDTGIKGLVDTASGLNSDQSAALGGLFSLVADLVEKGYRQKHAATAIHKAQPFVHELSIMLKEQLPKGLDLLLDNQKAQLGSLYRDIEIFRVDGVTQHTNPRLVASLYIESKASIDAEKDAVNAFEKVFDDIDKGHAALDRNRNKLWDRNTIQDLFQTASSIETQLGRVAKAFPSQ